MRAARYHIDVERESPIETWPAEALAKIALLEDALIQERERAKALEAERDRLRGAYQEMLVALELLRRRIEAAKAERVDTKQLELEFDAKRKELDALAGKLAKDPNAPNTPAAPPASPKRRTSTGRRDLADEATLPEERVEVTDPEMERLVAEGKAHRFSFDEESSKVQHRRASKVRLVVVRVKYRLGKLEGVAESDAAVATPSDESTTDGHPTKASDTSDSAPDEIPATAHVDRTFGTTVVTAAMPPSVIPRSIGAPSLFANIIFEKFRRGLPFFRQEEQSVHEGFRLGRGTMSRWAFEIGTEVGKTLIPVMWADAKSTAFCMATDATGVLVQPAPREDGKRQACKHGHFFAVLADRDHVFFEYTAREDSKAVMRMFRGYSGFVQADAKSVFNILFRKPGEEDPDDPELAHDGAERKEVGCWSHARRKFFECAVTNKDVAAREALFRIYRLFQNEEKWRELAPAQRKAMRDRYSRPEVESFFEWAKPKYLEIKHQRGLLRSAFGYADRQSDALMRYLDDGRLEMENNRTERTIKTLVIGRKAWLFIGSDDHGQPTANLLTLIASCKLHDLDAEAYLRDLFCVLPQWPKDRYLELAPKYWRATRARLLDKELEREIAWFTIPPPLELATASTPT